MKLSKVTLAILAAAPLIVNAATLERSGQSITPLFEDGNYAELSYRWTNPDIPGKDALGQKTGKDAAQQYGMASAALKFEPIEGVAAAVIYDEPYGVDYDYLANSTFKGIAADVDSQNITTLVANQFVPNLWVYGGLAFEKIEADVDIAALGYTLDFENSGIGYVGGLAYEKPEIALRTALTYRSKVQHRTSSTETSPAFVGLVGTPILPSRLEFDSPQSVNLDFQTGITPTTLLMASVRWVNWEDFAVTPVGYQGATKTSIVSYGDDQFTGTLMLGQKLSNNFSGIVGAMYSTGTGKPISVFGPYEEKTSVILGGKYNFSKAVDATLGVAYTMMKGTTTAAPSPVGKFDDGEAITLSGKIGYHF